MDYQFNHCSGGIDYDQSTKTTNIFVAPDSDLPEINDLREHLAVISKAVSADTNKLKPLIEQVVLLFNPAKVFMLKMAGVTDTDLSMYIELVIVLSDNKAPFTELRPVLDIALLKHKKVSYSLHSLGTVIDALNKGHIFYSLNCTPKTLVYDDGKTKLPPTSPTALQKMKEDVKNIFVAGLNKAFAFYQCAINLQELNQSPIMLFCLHQTAEHIYRSVLQSLNGYDKQTHSIRRLKIHVQRCAPQLNAVLPDDTPEEKHILDTLENCYIKPRYENGFTVCKEDLQVLFSKARLLQASAKGLIEDAVVSEI